jgi:serine/threonine protein kinase
VAALLPGAEAAIIEPAVQNATPFGKYLLLKRLAVGGMAELFLAEDTERREQVVIKRILPYLSQEAEFVRMFLDEARIAAQLHHPNVVTVYELGKLEDSIFLAMEHVDGIDLRKILQQETKRKSEVPYTVAAFVTAQVCAGLFYAHNTQGIDGRPLALIHRDVSPQNVMVGYDGRVKIVDFGIAKAGAFMEQSKPGVIKGKFLYLSPEQLSQEKLDHRADLFALGTMLYEVTTGRSPFHRTTTEAVIYAIRAEEPPPPTQFRADFPEPLARVIARCLEKDRTRRYQQAAEVEHDLQAYLDGAPSIDRVALSQYVSDLCHREQERTIPALQAHPAPADATSPERTHPIVQSVSKRQTAEIKATPAAEDDPRTQMANPAEIARAHAIRTPGQLSRLPTRRGSGTDYPNVGGDDSTNTDSTSSGRSGPDGTTSGSGSPGTVPILSREGPTRQERPDEPVFDDLIAPSRRRSIPEARRQAGEGSTEDVRAGTAFRAASLSRSPWFLGGAAFVGVALVGVLVLWLAQSRPPERPTLAELNALSPEPASRKPERPAPDPAAVKAADPPRLATAATSDAGAGEAAEPDEPTVDQSDDASPEPTESPTMATPNPGPGPGPAPHPTPRPHRHRSVLVFAAPAGTRILRDGKVQIPGRKYSVTPGSVRYEYQCPGRKTLQARTIRTAASEKPQLVNVPCKGR